MEYTRTSSPHSFDVESGIGFDAMERLGFLRAERMIDLRATPKTFSLNAMTRTQRKGLVHDEKENTCSYRPGR
jgi:hypothetical protein